MLYHTFDQDPNNNLGFVWSDVYKNNDLLTHLANPAVGVYLEAHHEMIWGLIFLMNFMELLKTKLLEP